MDTARILLPLAVGAALATASTSFARSKFIASEIGGYGRELLFCDLDGDGLKELVSRDGFNLWIFPQNAGRGFNRDLKQSYQLEERSSVLWPARLGRKAESLLVMTADGVSELVFSNQTRQPVYVPMIRQKTILPDQIERPTVKSFPIIARTDKDWPLLLVPVDDCLQVWRHGEGWTLAQSFPEASRTSIIPRPHLPGYTRTIDFTLCIEDFNRDQRDDLAIQCRDETGLDTYRIYAQTAEGLFTTEPALTYTNKADRFSWLCWVDLNRDGKVDLIRSVWPDEPSFLPGFPSGKIVVGICLADERGHLPPEPQAFFRKYDWTPAIPVIDLDGDGYLDLILGYSVLDKESLRRQFIAKQLDLNLKFSFYRPDTGFPSTSDFQRDVPIHLDRQTLVLGWGQRDFFARLVNVTGDFDGDGKRDLLVRDHGDTISIYFFVSRERGFSRNADLKFDCPEPIESFEVHDLNGDGISDLVVKLEDRNAFRIFISDRN